VSAYDWLLLALLGVVLALGVLLGWLACLAAAREAFSTYNEIHKWAHERLGLRPPKGEA
jgi:hypothetical protein